MQDQQFDFDFEPEPEERPEPAPVVPKSDPEPAAEPAPDRLNGRQLMMIAGVMVGSGALMIGVLGARGSSPSAPATSAGSSAVSTSAGAPEPPAASPGWIENSSTWTGTARRAVAFELQARNETQVWMRIVRPLLVVRCVEGRIDTFVFTDSPAAMEPEDEDHTVRISIDGEDARTARWPDSSAHDALFAPDGAALASQLERASMFRFGYTPHNAPPVVATFDVAGLSGKIGASKACGRR
jgi:hypothetical protein